MAEMNKKGVLVLHGLTTTPAVMRSVVDLLIENSFEISAPVLPGHGTTAKDLSTKKWTDWWTAAQEAFFELKSRVSRVSIIGLSLGGLLALKLAEDERWGVSSMVTISTPLLLNDRTEKFLYPLVKYTPAGWLYRYSKKDWSKSVADAGGREFYTHHSYNKIPINSVMEIFKLKKEVQDRLSEIRSPVLAIHAKEDETAPLANLDILKNGIARGLLQMMVVERSKHIVTLDFDRNIVAKSAMEFVKKFSM